MNVLLMALAGGIGTLLRYLIGKQITYSTFPLATISINSLGSLFLGFLFIKYAQSNLQFFLVLGIGFCGGFTTYSTFSLELYKMFLQAQYLNILIYLISTVSIGFLAVFIGAYLAKI